MRPSRTSPIWANCLFRWGSRFSISSRGGPAGMAGRRRGGAAVGDHGGRGDLPAIGPYFFVGWFWYVGMLVPVLGLTYVGAHARADRYTYLSQIGLYIALVWGAMRLGGSVAGPAVGVWRRLGARAGGPDGLHLAADGFWQDSKTLWEHALACDPKNATAHSCSAWPWRNGREPRSEAISAGSGIGPDERNIYNGIRAKAAKAWAILRLKRETYAAAAIEHFEQAWNADPGFAPAHMNLGTSWPRTGISMGPRPSFAGASSWQPGQCIDLCSLALMRSEAQKARPTRRLRISARPRDRSQLRHRPTCTSPFSCRAR